MNKIFVLVILSFSILLVNGQNNFGSLLPDADAAVDYFLKIDGIDGESADSKHKDWIDVESFSFGVSTGSSGGAGVGKVKFTDFNFVKKVDKASPILMVESASGKHFPKAEIVVVKDGTTAMTWKLKDILISFYQIGAGDEIPIEMVSMNLASVEVTYGATTAGWDIKANKKTSGSTETTETTPSQIPAAKTESSVKSSSTPSSTPPTTPSNTQPVQRAPVDSDGDGITDDADKCPSEAETKNSYQDDDGCPDKAPATTTVVPKTVTPIAPKITVPLK